MAARDATYGDFIPSGERVGRLWAIVLGLPAPIPCRTVQLMLAAMKLSRALDSPDVDDHYVDMANYAVMSGVAAKHAAVTKDLDGEPPPI